MTQPQQPFKRGRNVFTRTLFHPVTYYFIQAAGFIGIGYTMLIHTKWGEGTVLYDLQRWMEGKRHNLLSMTPEEIEKQKQIIKATQQQNNKD